MEIGTVRLVDINDEMRAAYLDYAMSVITARALPDVRDGLKPVQRRILYAMHDMGLHPDRPYKKSARIVGECFVKDTLVATQRGLLPIQDVQRGDMVSTERGTQPVVELYEMPPRPLVEIELENGLRNVATPSQLFRVVNSDLSFSWKEAGQLRPGDWIVLKAGYLDVAAPPALVPFKGKEKVLSPQIAYVLGLLMSDGWVSKEGWRRRLGFYSAERQIVERVAELLRLEFGYEATIETKEYIHQSVSGKALPRRGYIVRINRDELNAYFVENFGLADLNTLTKHIPSQVLQAPKDIMFAFLSGLIDGDGSVHRDRNVIHYGSISLRLIEELQVLLHHLGIPSQRYVVERHAANEQTFYWLEITGIAAQRLAAGLDLAHPGKRRLLAQMKQGGTKRLKLEQIPYAAPVLFGELSRHHLGGGWYQDTDEHKFRQGITYPGGTKIRYSRDLYDKPLYASQLEDWGIREKLERIGSPYAERVAHILDDRVSFAQVARVSPRQPKKTYDLQVAEDHMFVANGMVVHNCLGKYHPHGDQAVYDAMVRMAQDFSMRYTLVDGQGNFGCFTGDTKIKLLDGTEQSFEELARLDPSEVFYVYSIGKTGRIVVGEGRNARVTRRDAQIIELVLDNGETIRCTPDHRFMLRDGTYKQAQHLTPDDSLMPGYFDDLLDEAERYNHRVIAIRWLDERADAYDITVDEHHNFLLACGVFVHNSVDGDAAAAMRYTEARLTAMAEEMLVDIKKDTVDLIDNFDGTLKEPSVLPAKLPNLLLNGASGIAVGMATNIPPHNLVETCDALIHLLGNYDAIEDITVDDLMQFIKGPDFPTGGIILGNEGIRNAYATGKGRVVMRAKAHIEEIKGNRHRIVVTELPYQVNKATLIERIAGLVRDKRVDTISDLRDESDRQGMFVVIELKRGADPQTTLYQLLKYTQMQQTFGVNLLALVNGEPRVLPLRRMLTHYLNHRQEIIQRRSEYDLAQARHRAHILEGLRIALANLDDVIQTIRRAPDADTAKKRLMRKFKLSEIQAQAILDMQLRRLAALERKKIEEEYEQVIKTIAFLEDLLASPRKIRLLIREELLDLRKHYGDTRRTRITEDAEEEISAEDLILQEDVLITITRRGYVKRVAANTYRPQRRGGRGVTGITTREADEVQYLFIANTLDSILFFTDQGRVFQQKAHQIPDADRTAKGIPMSNLLPLERGETATAAVPVPDFDKAEYLVMATIEGKIKRTVLKEFEGVRPSGIIAINLEEGDALGWVKLTQGDQEVIIVTEKGQAIRFRESEVRPMGRVAGGVNAIKLGKGDRVTSMDIVRPEAYLLIVTTNGCGKRTPLAEYPTQSRYGMGVRTIDARKLKETGPITAARVVDEHDEVTFISADGIVMRTWVDSIPQMGRATRGAGVMNLKKGDAVASVARLNGKPEPEIPPPPEPPKRKRARRTTGPTKKKTTAKKPAAKKQESKKQEGKRQEGAKKPAATKPAATKKATTKKPTSAKSTKKTATRKPAAAKPTKKIAAGSGGRKKTRSAG